MDVDAIVTNIKTVVEHLESLVSEAWTGPARSYFEIPVGETFVRGVYRTYVVQAPTCAEALSGLEACVMQQIASATARSPTTNLVWRMEEKIEVRSPSHGDMGWEARTRIVVLPEDNM